MVKRFIDHNGQMKCYDIKKQIKKNKIMLLQCTAVSSAVSDEVSAISGRGFSEVPRHRFLNAFVPLAILWCSGLGVDVVVVRICASLLHLKETTVKTQRVIVGPAPIRKDRKNWGQYLHIKKARFHTI